MRSREATSAMATHLPAFFLAVYFNFVVKADVTTGLVLHISKDFTLKGNKMKKTFF